MLTFPPVRLPADDWTRLMRLAFAAGHDLHPVGTFLRAEVHRAIVADDIDDDVVRLNAWVTYRADWGPTESRLLVHPDDDTCGGHHLSVLSPVGAALIGIRVGDRMPFFDLDRTLRLVTPLDLKREPTTLGLLRRRADG